MSNALKNAVESGTNTLSDLVDEARARIEDLPPLANARRKRHRKSRSSILAVVLLVIVATFLAKQMRPKSTVQAADRMT
jgi:hypothetical protein